MDMILIIILALTFLCATTLALGLLNNLNRVRFDLMNRLEKSLANPAVLKKQDEDELSKPFNERIIRPILNGGSQIVARLMPAKSRDKLKHSLQLAGNPGNLQANEYLALNYGLMLGLALLTWFVSFIGGKDIGQQSLMAVSGGVIGYLLGKSYLARLIRTRQATIQKELPDVLDLLTVSMEAGLGFDAALLRVVDKTKGTLAEELRKTLQEMQVGQSRRQALRDLAERTGVDDILTFVGSMIQADQLGVSVSKVIRIQAEQVRQKRRQRAEETAMKAPIKMLIPMVFFIFPSIFIVLLGPAAMNIMKAFAGGR